MAGPKDTTKITDTIKIVLKKNDKKKEKPNE